MTWKIAGINFDHMHMGDNLRMAYEHPEAEIVALCDEQPERMRDAVSQFQVPQDQLFTNVDECIKKSQADIVLLCPETNTHRKWVEKVAPRRMEDPVASISKPSPRPPSPSTNISIVFSNQYHFGVIVI